jgi:hypothetical protein
MTTDERVKLGEALYTEEPNTGCWLWIGAQSNGYGKVMRKRQCLWAHRVMWEQEHGPIPEGLTVDHICRVTWCVNPAHLRVVSMRENLLRGTGIVARNAAKACCSRCGGPYTLIERHAPGRSFERVCYACANARRRKVSGCL